jgi:hypothetical protein
VFDFQTKDDQLIIKLPKKLQKTLVSIFSLNILQNQKKRFHFVTPNEKYPKKISNLGHKAKWSNRDFGFHV